METVLNSGFKGATVTVAVTGLPILITGEVVYVADEVVSLRMKNGSTVYIEPSLIAFVY